MGLALTQIDSESGEMDETMAKLPRYVFQRANGSFRYKRNVPKELRVIFGKDTLYRQLGNTLSEAMKEYPYVHAKIEALFDLERKKTDRERALEVIRENLGEEAAELVLARAVPEYSPLDYDLNELAYSLAGKVSQGVLEQVYQGELKDPPITLETVLSDYLDFKADGEERDKDLHGRVERLRKEMTRLYGKTKMEVVPVADITRQDATALRDVLLEQMAPNSVLRTLGTLKAGMNHSIIERGLNIPNVFAQLRIKGAGASRTDRLPISEDQLKSFQAVVSHLPVASSLVMLLTDTGARLGEVVGLEVQDVDPQAGALHIRPNSIRGLKTKTSVRTVPMSERVRECLSGQISGQPSRAPIFERYARPRGSDAASAMLMKHLRGVVDDPKVTIHSLRHRMKDCLRNTGCPEAISRELLGHAQPGVAANYGAGYALEVMREHMNRVWRGKAL